MKKCTVAAFSIFMLITFQSNAQNQDEMMKAWMAFMTPGEMHTMLGKSAGEWTTEMTMWMDPNAQPMVSKGSCTNKMIMGGRYQETKYKGDFMGQPMEGTGTVGYNNADKQFESTWLDNMGSGIMTSKGTYDAATKTITFKGSQTDPMTGKDCAFRETYKFIDGNNELMEMYTTHDGKESKTMQIKFTRKK